MGDGGFRRKKCCEASKLSGCGEIGLGGVKSVFKVGAAGSSVNVSCCVDSDLTGIWSGCVVAHDFSDEQSSSVVSHDLMEITSDMRWQKANS